MAFCRESAPDLGEEEDIEDDCLLEILLFDRLIKKRKGEGRNSCTKSHLSADSYLLLLAENTRLFREPQFRTNSGILQECG